MKWRSFSLYWYFGWLVFISIVATVLTLLAPFVRADGSWTLVDGSNCGTSGADKCVETSGSGYVSIFYRETDGAFIGSKGLISGYTDYPPYASPYALLGDLGLGDWPTVDFQAVLHTSDNACDSLDVGACMALSGSSATLCASYPGGVYQAFSSQTCIAADEATPPVDPASTTNATTTTMVGDIYSLFIFGVVSLGFGVWIVVANCWNDVF